MSSPSHHAFWNPSYDSRGSRLNKILIIEFGTRVFGDSDEANNIKFRATPFGYTVTTISNYTAFLNEDLTKYAHIWDLGYNTVIPLQVQDKYIDYLQNGGAAFLIGENPYFQTRNDSVCRLIGAAGGGTVTTGGGGGEDITVPIVPEFLLANQTPTVTFAAPSGFPNYGTGTPITTGLTCAVMWKTGSLSACLSGALVSILDVNFLQTQYLQSDFIENLIACSDKK